MLEAVNIRKTTFILFFVVVLFYAPSFFHGFVWDDLFIMNYQGFKDFSHIVDIFTSLKHSDVLDFSNYYRPLAFLTFFLDYHLWKLAPFGYHLENVLLHALTVSLFFLLLIKVYEKTRMAFFAAAIFALQPVVVEPVNFVAARPDLLCGMFILASFIALNNSTEQPLRRSILGGLGLFAALLSKEPAVMVPPFLAALYVLERNNQRSKPSGAIVLGSFGITVLYLIFRSLVLKTVTTHGGFQLSIESLRYTVTTLYQYFRLMLAPFPLNADYPTNLLTWNSPQAIGALGVMGFLVFLAVSRKTPSPVRAGAIWLIVGFIPISNIIEIPSTLIADRYLYVPLMGFSLIAGYVIDVLAVKRKVVVITASAVLLATYAFIGQQRMPVWSNNLTLWKDTALKSPLNSRAQYNLGISYKNAGMYKEAVVHLKESAQMDPERKATLIELGKSLMLTKRYNEAIAVFEKTKSLDPADAEIENEIGVAYAMMGDIRDAVQFFKLALQKNPKFIDAIFNLGRAYLRLENLDQADTTFHTVLRLDPGNKSAKKYLEEIRKERKKK